jgi:hypothetical protein
MKETVSSSETSVLTRATRRNIPRRRNSTPSLCLLHYSLISAFVCLFVCYTFMHLLFSLLYFSLAWLCLFFILVFLSLCFTLVPLFGLLLSRACKWPQNAFTRFLCLCPLLLVNFLSSVLAHVRWPSTHTSQLSSFIISNLYVSAFRLISILYTLDFHRFSRYSEKATCLRVEESGFDSMQGHRLFCTHLEQPVCPVHPPVQWTLRAVSPGFEGGLMKLKAHLLGPELRTAELHLTSP